MSFNCTKTTEPVGAIKEKGEPIGPPQGGPELESSQQGQMDGQVVDRRLRGGQEGPHFLRIQASGWRWARGWRGHPVRRVALQKFPINGNFQGPV